MLRCEYSAPQLLQMDDDHREQALTNLWGQIHLLTGVMLFADDATRAYQMACIERFIMRNERFARLTPDEIELAFYLNVQGAFADSVPDGGRIIKHYNAELNAEYVGSVLGAYIERRAKLQEKLHDDVARVTRLLQSSLPTFDLKQYEELIEQDYQWLQQGQRGLITYVDSKYRYLRYSGAMLFQTLAEWKEIFEHWLVRKDNTRLAAIHTRKAFYIQFLEAAALKGWPSIFQQPN